MNAINRGRLFFEVKYVHRTTRATDIEVPIIGLNTPKVCGVFIFGDMKCQSMKRVQQLQGGIANSPGKVPVMNY